MGHAKRQSNVFVYEVTGQFLCNSLEVKTKLAQSFNGNRICPREVLKNKLEFCIEKTL